ncbi:hypothetical protein [Sinomonas flava]|uniref:Uncharacterized protein n=1 Tax=Sinomonas flava TaxID=496857 RepID=A0ABN3BQ18_9MICC
MSSTDARRGGAEGSTTAKRTFAGRAAAAAGGVVAAATLAAGVVMSPAPAPTARLDGVHADLQRAVALRQITGEQAAFLEAQLRQQILSDAAASGAGTA